MAVPLFRTCFERTKSLFSAGGLDPAYMGLGPVPAVRKVLKQTGMTIDGIDMIELNKAEYLHLCSILEHADGIAACKN